MSLVQLPQSELSYSAEHGWRGSITYATERGNERAYCRSLMGAVYSGVSGDEAPVVTRVGAVWEPHNIPNVSMIRAYYETPRIEGKARLTLGGSYEYRLPRQNVIKDLDGKIVKGPHLTEGVWIPAVKSGPYPIVRLSTAATSLDIKETLSYVGTMNASGHSYIFGADAGQLLMLRPTIGRIHGELIMVDYNMALNLDGWDNVVESQLGVWIVVKSKVYEISSAGLWIEDTSEEPRKTLSFKPMKKRRSATDDTIDDSVPEPRRMIEEETWSKLASLTIW